jgi:hypothetical protein
MIGQCGCSTTGRGRDRITRGVTAEAAMGTASGSANRDAPAGSSPPPCPRLPIRAIRAPAQLCKNETNLVSACWCLLREIGQFFEEIDPASHLLYRRTQSLI